MEYDDVSGRQVFLPAAWVGAEDVTGRGKGAE